MNDWRERSEFWAGFESNQVPSRGKRQRSSETLVLCGRGITLRVEAGTLLVKNGFTHYPQLQETHRYFRGDLSRAARIVVLDGNGHLTFDVLDWLAEQDIPLIRVLWTGEVVSVIGGSGYSADRSKVDWQRRTRDNEPDRVHFCCDLVRRKLENSAATLESAFRSSRVRDASVANLKAEALDISERPPTSVDALRGVEGRAAAVYFDAWQDVPLRWKEQKRKPVPDEWRSLGPRSSLRAGKKSKNRNATHPVNAMLNYAYAVAVGQLKITALADGYDPTIGIMHHGYRDGPAYALDLVEPVRPLVDRAVLGLAFGHELHPADFVIRADGACRLNPQMARRVVQLAVSVA